MKLFISPSTAERSAADALTTILEGMGCKVFQDIIPSGPLVPPYLVMGTRRYLKNWISRHGDHGVHRSPIQPLDCIDLFGKENLVNNDSIYCSIEDMPNDMSYFVKEAFNDGCFKAGVYSHDTLPAFLKENSDYKVLVSPKKRILTEYRFFVLDGNIIAGCQYAQGPYMHFTASVPGNVLEFTEVAVSRASKCRTISNTYVLDVAEVEAHWELGTKRLGILEVNGFSSSGLMGVDKVKFAKGLMDHYHPQNPEKPESQPNALMGFAYLEEDGTANGNLTMSAKLPVVSGRLFRYGKILYEVSESNEKSVLIRPLCIQVSGPEDLVNQLPEIPEFMMFEVIDQNKLLQVVSGSRFQIKLED